MFVHLTLESELLYFISVFYRFIDCGKTCAVGRLNKACDTCVCESSNIQGRILSTTGNPVSYAALAEQSAPLRVIAESNSTGFFSLNETCNTSTVIVSRDGFQDAVVEITDAYQTIYMELEGTLLYCLKRMFKKFQKNILQKKHFFRR